MQQTFFEQLDQIKTAINALGVALTHGDTLLYVNPPSLSVDVDRAKATISEATSYKSNGTETIFIPLDAFPKHVATFQISENAMTESTIKVLNLLTTQAATLSASSTQALLQKMAETIPQFHQSHSNLATYVKIVSDAYLGLGWDAVRVSLRNHQQDAMEHHVSGAAKDSLPTYAPQQHFTNLSSDLWSSGPNTPPSTAEWPTHVLHSDHAWHQLLIPIRTRDGDINALIELFQTSNRPTPELPTIQYLLVFAQEFGSALERELLIQSLKHTHDVLIDQIDELEFMHKADREISSRLDSDRILQFTLDWSMRRTAANAGAIIVVDPITAEASVQESLGYPSKELHRLTNRQNPTIIWRSIRERTLQLVEDVSQDPHYIDILPNTSAQIALPMISSKRVVGALVLESDRMDYFDDNAIGFLERILSVTAVALDNAFLLQQAEQLADDMSIIYNAGRTISASLEWEQAIQSIAQSLALAVQNADAFVYTYDTVNEVARLVSIYATGPNVDNLPVLDTLLPAREYPEITATFKSNRMRLLELLDDDSALATWLRNLGYVSVGIAPMQAQGDPLGIALILKHSGTGILSPSEQFVIESLATQAAAMLRQATLYTEIRSLETLKSEMIRMASHDLRSPIANVTGYIELLELDLADIKTPDMEMYLGSIRRGIATMETLVQDLLTLEKIESQKDAPLEPINFGELVTEIHDQQIESAHLKGQTLVLEIADHDFQIQGNRIQVRQSVMNLISNGIKYTPDGGKIIIRIFKNDEFPNRIYFQTEDNGYGIPKKRQARIFERFYRAKQTGTEHIPGTGLGLSMVKSIIERHNGEIYFESTEGVGSTFTFWLPDGGKTTP